MSDNVTMMLIVDAKLNLFKKIDFFSLLYCKIFKQQFGYLSKS